MCRELMSRLQAPQMEVPRESGTKLVRRIPRPQSGRGLPSASRDPPVPWALVTLRVPGVSRFQVQPRDLWMLLKLRVPGGLPFRGRPWGLRRVTTQEPPLARRKRCVPLESV